MNIIIFGPYPINKDNIRGGIEASVFGLAGELSNYHIVHVFDFPRIRETDHTEIKENLTIHRYSNNGKHNVNAASRLQKIANDIISLNPDICHLHSTGKLSADMYDILRQHNIPAVITVHGLAKVEKHNTLLSHFNLKHLYQYFTQTYYEKRLLEKVENIIVDTEYVKQAIEDYGLKHLPHMHVIPQGIDSIYFEDNNPQRQEDILLSVGAITPRKGHLLTIDMFNILRNKGVKAQLIIIGSLADENYFSKLKDTIAISPYHKDIKLLTNIPQQKLLEAFRSAKLFVLHSQEESQGIVFAEAMAMGLPVVATNAGGIPYVVKDGMNGFLCNYTDTDTMAEMVSKLLTDHNLWDSYSQNAKKHAEYYNWKQIASRIMAVYKSAT